LRDSTAKGCNMTVHLTLYNFFLDHFVLCV